jgi:hypothetical protein
MVSGVRCRRLCGHISQIPGVVFTRKHRYLRSSARPFAEFVWRGHAFYIDDGGDMGGDGLWVMPKDGVSHPAEIEEIRAHIQSLANEGKH